MKAILWLSICREFKNKFPYKTSLLFRTMGIFVLLNIYWFTAKAFVPESSLVELKGTNYFVFILVGELTLSVPAVLLSSFSRSIRQNLLEGTFEQLSLSPVPFVQLITIQGLVSGIIELIFVILTFVAAFIFFDLNFSFTGWVQAGFIQLLALPLFIGLGLLVGSLLLNLGRGEASLGMITTILTVLSGAYFPTKVLPEALAETVNRLSPFNILLFQTRLSLGSPQFENDIIGLSLLLGVGVVIFLLAILILNWSIDSYKQKSKPLHLI